MMSARAWVPLWFRELLLARRVSKESPRPGEFLVASVFTFSIREDLNIIR